MKNLKWYEDRDACKEALKYLGEQPSPEAAWRGDAAQASWMLWLVAEVTPLAEKCRWVSAELARQFALLALGAAGVTGHAVDALRGCARVVGAETSLVAETAARAADAAARATHAADDSDAVGAACAAIGAAIGAAALARYIASSADSVATASAAATIARAGARAAAAIDASIANANSDAATISADRRLAALVRSSIPWAWVEEACAKYAPELLEVASP